MRFVLLIQEGGAVAWGIVATPGLTLPLLVVLAVLAALRFRVPAPLWFLPALGALLLGHLGVGFGTLQVRDALAHASPEVKSVLIAGGLSEALSARLLAQGSATLLFLAAAVLATASNLRAGEKPTWTVAHAVGPLVLGVLGAGASVPAALRLGGMGVALATTGLTGGLLLAIASLRTDEEPVHAARMVGARGLVGTLVVAAALSVFAVERTWSRIEAFRSVAYLDPSEKAVALAEALAWRPWLLVPGIALIALAAVAAIAPGARSLDRRAAIGAVATAAVLAVVGLVRLGLDLWSGAALAAVMGTWSG